jgi:uncharacterized protein YqcC (DUF446 family)
MTETFLITEKINEVIEEMKKTGVWENETPPWVKEFSEWLQFVYLPNRMQEAASNRWVIEKKYIVPQAVKFFGNDVKKGKLLQLLIELDSLS